jgi:ribonuclease J
MRERRAMSFAGVISVTLALDERGRVAGEPAMLLEGVPDAVHAPVSAAVDEAVRRYNPKKQSEEQFLEAVRRAARRAAQDAWGKKPVTRVQAIRV